MKDKDFNFQIKHPYQLYHHMNRFQQAYLMTRIDTG